MKLTQSEIEELARALGYDPLREMYPLILPDAEAVEAAWENRKDKDGTPTS